MRTIALSMALLWLIANAATAGEPCKAPGACTEVKTCGSPDSCGRCGHCGPCEKHCQVVCEMKEVKKTVWVVKCSEFCVPLPNCPHNACGACSACCAAEKCEPEAGCDNGCGKKCDPCASENSKCFVPPKCGKMRDKKTLEKKEVVCKVPTYKCVVVYSCGACDGSNCDGATDVKKAPAPAGQQPVPPAPPIKSTQDVAPLPPILNTSFTE